MAVSDRASYVQNQYRPVTLTDQATLDECSTAEYLEVETNLDAGGVAALAQELLDDYKRSTVTNKVVLDTVTAFSADSFNKLPPMVQTNLDGFAVRNQRVQSVTIDLNAFQTTITGRG